MNRHRDLKDRDGRFVRSFDGALLDATQSEAPRVVPESERAFGDLLVESLRSLAELLKIDHAGMTKPELRKRLEEEFALERLDVAGMTAAQIVEALEGKT